MKVLMCEILVTFTKLDSSEWPRLVYSSEKNNFLVHDLDRLQGGIVIVYCSCYIFQCYSGTSELRTL